jgi:hypothetical protein
MATHYLDPEQKPTDKQTRTMCGLFWAKPGTVRVPKSARGYAVEATSKLRDVTCKTCLREALGE